MDLMEGAGGGGGGGMADAFILVIPPPTDPLYYFETSIFWLKYIYTYFEGGARIKKCEFLVKFFQKDPKNDFFFCLFSNICLRRRKFNQNEVFIVIWESSKNHLVRPKKKFDKIFEIFFENSPPPLEKILDPPLSQMNVGL